MKFTDLQYNHQILFSKIVSLTLKSNFSKSLMILKILIYLDIQGWLHTNNIQNLLVNLVTNSCYICDKNTNNTQCKTIKNGLQIPHI